MGPQNFWQFLIVIWGGASGKITRILGVVQGTAAVLAGTGIIPEADLKYYMALLAILTYWRGQSVANTVASSKVDAKIAEAAGEIPSIVKPPEKLG